MKKQFILNSTITASILLTPVAMLTSHEALAQESTSTTKDLDSNKEIKTDTILKEESKKKIKPLENEKKSIINEQAGETSQSNEYNKAFNYDNKTYDFGQGSELSGSLKALDIEKNISDQDIDIVRKDVSNIKNSNVANITVPGPDKDSLGTGSATAISKHILLTNDHVVRKSQDDAFTAHDPKDINIYPNRNGNDIPYKLTAKKVEMLKSGDAALIYVDEDLSKYMQISDIADEDSISNMKEKDDVTASGYPAGKTHNSAVRNGYGDYGTPYDSHGKFIMNGTNIHPVFYYKSYAEPGMSGSPVMNKDNKLIGIHAGILDKNNGNDGDTSYGFTITKELRKDILKAIENDGVTTNEPTDTEKPTTTNNEAKADDTTTDNPSNTDDNEATDPKDDTNKTDDSDNTNNDNSTDDNNTNSEDTSSDNDKTDDTSDNKSTEADNSDTSESDDSTTNNDDKSNTSNDTDKPTNSESSKSDTTNDNNKDKSDTTTNDTDSSTNEDTTNNDSNSTNNDEKTDDNTNSENTSSSNNNDEENTDNTTDKEKTNESTDNSSTESDESSTSDKNAAITPTSDKDKDDNKDSNNDVKSKTSEGKINKEKEEKTVAASNKQNNEKTDDKSKTDDNDKQDDKEKDKQDKNNKDNNESSDKDKNPTTNEDEKNTKPTDQNGDELFKDAENVEDQSGTAPANNEEPEEPTDHQTFGALPDTGSTAGNVTELIAVLATISGLGLLAAQRVYNWRQNKLNQ